MIKYAHRKSKGDVTVRKNFDAKPWFYPLPVLLIGTYDEKGNADLMNAAWGGLYDANKVVLCLSAGHKTTKNILAKKAFTVSFADAAHVVEADYVGLVSANDETNKLQKTGFHAIQSDVADAPLFEELPLTFICRLMKVSDEGNIIGKIINISADEKILNDNGEIDPLKLNPISFDPIRNAYVEMGKTIGNAFHDGLKLK